jgi:rhodanese-related sulfurtransferase/DNA-directed RNA polymerase subunit RPC12/RpoP
MNKSFRGLTILIGFFLLCATTSVFSQASQENSAAPQKEYVCLPCGSDCDKIVYRQPGKCSHCGMQLIEKKALAFKTIQPGALCGYLAAHPDVVLLDVRTRAEFEGKAKPDHGRLKNAINIPIQELSSRLPELEKYKGKEIIVYCSHSQRSPRASYLLTQNGFTNVTNMAGGLSVWKSSVKDKSCMEK